MSEQAVKIFEALSEVDEELLDRCNRKTVRKAGTAYGLFQRYAGAMAAGICLIVMGAVSWGGYQLITGSSGSDSSGSNGAYMELSDMAQSMEAAEGDTCGWDGGGGTENIVTAAGSSAAVAEDTNGAADSVTTSLEAAKSESTQELLSGTPAKEQTSLESGNTEIDPYGKLREQETALSDSREEVSWEEACATEPFSSYLPTVIPASYEAFSARRSTSPEQWDNLIFKWTDGEHILSLNMTSGEVVTREDIERWDGVNEFVTEDFRKDRMPDPPAGEPLAFTLYYMDGMKIEFQGYLTSDEMWEVVESIKK